KASSALRNARQRNRRCERTAAALGKYYPAFAYAQSGAKSAGVAEFDSVSSIRSIGDSFCVTVAHICVSRSQPSHDQPDRFDACANKVPRGNAQLDQET